MNEESKWLNRIARGEITKKNTKIIHGKDKSIRIIMNELLMLV